VFCFQENRLIILQGSAFSGLNTTKMYLDLSSNQLSSIHDDAFEGVDDAIRTLKLEHNRLVSVPAALGNLSRLEFLDIHDNPIVTFDASVMGALSGHLDVLSMGSSALTIWPSELHRLEGLKALHIYDISMTNLPTDAFRGFEGSLYNLQIENTQLVAIPSAVCHISALTNFYFNNNSNDKPRAYIVPDCPQPLATVTYVSLSSNNVTKFPDVFKIFPNVATLDVSNNTFLRTIDRDIPTNTHLTSLMLKDNGFNHIPHELGNLANLRILDLGGNFIGEIWNGDLDHLTHINRLELSQNPIRIVEDMAFYNMSVAYYLGLDNTQLKSLPKAVLGMEKLHSINFRGTPADCSCSALSWLNNMTDVNSLQIKGDCSYGTSIQTFLIYTLDSC